MKWISHLKINQKIFASIMLSIAFLAAVFTWIIWDSMTNMMTEDLTKRGHTIAKSIAEIGSDYILYDDQYALDRLIKDNKKIDDEIRYILVYDNQQTLYAHTFSTDDTLPKGILHVKMPSKSEELKTARLQSNEGGIMDVIVPIEAGEVGYVRVGMSEEKSLHYIYSRILKLVIATLLVAVSAIGIAYFATKFITKPINNLVDVALGISKGNLQLRAKQHSKDEIGKLATTFNDMADHLIRSRVEIDDLLKKLQQKDVLRDTLISKLLSVQEDERKRISHELHDETSQALASLMVTMRIMANEAKDDEQRSLLYTSRDLTANILKQIRDLAVELRPPILDKMGVVSAIKKYTKNYAETTSINVHVAMPEHDIAVSEAISLTLYRIVQESMNNVLKHTNATEVWVELIVAHSHVKLNIRDNGEGIHESALKKANEENRIGIHGMRERAELQDGHFMISKHHLGGTTVSVILPLT